MVEQRSPKPRAEGSNPSAPAIAVVAQSAEHFLGKEEVGSSNLLNSSNRRKLRLVCDEFFCKYIKVIVYKAPLLLVITKKDILGFNIRLTSTLNA